MCARAVPGSFRRFPRLNLQLKYTDNAMILHDIIGADNIDCLKKIPGHV